VADVGIVDQQGNYTATKKGDWQGGEVLQENLPQVPEELLKNVQGIVKPKPSITPTGTSTIESKPTPEVKIAKEDIINAMKPEEKSKYDSLSRIASLTGNKSVYAAQEMTRIEKAVEKRLNKPIKVKTPNLIPGKEDKPFEGYKPLEQERVEPGYIGDEQYKANLETNLKQYESKEIKTPEELKYIETAKQKLQELNQSIPTVSMEDTITKKLNAKQPLNAKEEEWIKKSAKDMGIPQEQESMKKIRAQAKEGHKQFLAGTFSEKNIPAELGLDIPAQYEKYYKEFKAKKYSEPEARRRAKKKLADTLYSQAHPKKENTLGKKGIILRQSVDNTTDKEIMVEGFYKRGNDYLGIIDRPNPLYLNEGEAESLRKQGVKELSEEEAKAIIQEKQIKAGIIKAPVKPKTFPKSSGQTAGMSEPLGESQDKAYMSDYTPQDHTTLVEMPELVKLAQELTGKAPIVAKLRGALGKFYGNKEGAPIIKIRNDIFKNPFLAGQVLTHEIGHLVDWLPDYTLSRGNLIGRLLTLKKFMQSTFGDLNNKEIKEELKAATIYWHPFNPENSPEDYIKIRFSSKELYAESISMLLIQPEKLKELAPKFYEAFWNNIDEKPDVKDALLGLQDFLNLGDAEKYKVRSEDLSKSFRNGESLFYEARNRYKLAQRSWLYKFKIQYIDKITPIIDKVKEAEKKGIKINPEDNPKYYLEDYNYIGGKIKNLLEEIHTEVIKPVEDKLTTLEDLGKYLFLNRVITERADIANPLGHNRDTALKQLKYMEESLGKEKFDNLKSAAERFNLIMKRLLTQGEQSGLFKPDTFAEIITNPAYATFQVLDHLDDYVSSGIISQRGTLKNIANPFISTILKMISTLRTIERNNANKSVIKFMKDTFPAEIEPAKIRRFGKYKAEAVEKENFGIIKVREEGKFKAYYVDPYIADSVNYTPTPTANALIQVLSWLNKGWFRPVYVGLNLGFQSYNLIRDFKRAWKLNPHTSFPAMLAKYKEASPIAFRRIWGDITDPVIKEMQENAMLSVTYNDITRGIEEQDETMSEYLLQQYGVLEKNKSLNPFIKLINFIEEIGNFIETLPKVAGYLSRKDTGHPMKEISHEVRVYSGSPDFLRKGEAYYSYNNFFLFSNAIKEGFRGDIEGSFKNPRTRSGYWWKTAATSILPKILMWLAAAGLFGEGIAKNYKKQGEYDKTNYFTIPMGFTPEGKAIYFRMPDDETGRLLSGMLWKGLNMGKGGSVTDVINIAGGQIPSVSPSVEVPVAWATFFMGGNPYDIQRGNTVLTRDEKTAGGVYALEPMFSWTVSKLGGGSFLSTFGNNKTTGEKILSISPILGRFIKIGDYGDIESKRQERQKPYQVRAQRRLERRR
jgi:hypothetical protein